LYKSLSFGGDIPGEDLVNELIINYPDIYLVFGLPLFGILGMILVTVLLAFFGERIYNWDVNLVYGRVFRKLDEIIADIEELRS